MTLTNYLRSGVAALAIAAVMPSAVAADPVPSHPLLSPNAAITYTVQLSKAFEAATGQESAHARARGFITELEAVLKESRDKPRTVIYPKNPIVGTLSVVAIVPPTGMEKTPIGVCLQQGLKVPGKEELVHTNVGTFQIESNGNVVSKAWDGVKVGGMDTATGKFQSACAPYRTAYIQLINENSRMASTPEVPAPPPAPAATATVAALGPARTLAQAPTSP